MPPAARVTDMHVCPMVTVLVPHVGGPILPPGAPTVLIDFLPAATVTSMATCVGPPDVIIMGSTGVFINYMPAARLGDPTAHGGAIVMGSPTCIIGEVGAPSPGAGGAGAIAAGLAASGVNNPSDANASVYATGSPAAQESGPADGQSTEQKSQIIKDICTQNGITDPDIQESYIDSADLDKPVTKETLHKGDKFDVWVRNGGQPGMYSMPPGTDPGTVAIETQNRHLEQYEVQQDLQVVKSTANNFDKGKVEGVGGKGGGTQYMLPPNWKNSVKKI